MSIRLAGLVAGALLLASSACSSNYISHFQEDRLATLSDRQICQDYYHYRSDPKRYGRLSAQAKDQLETRMLQRAMIREELHAVRRGELRQGMSECALLAAWGPPRQTRWIEERGGQRGQYLYPLEKAGQTIRVYLANARVVSWE